MLLYLRLHPLCTKRMPIVFTPIYDQIIHITHTIFENQKCLLWQLWPWRPNRCEICASTSHLCFHRGKIRRWSLISWFRYLLSYCRPSTTLTLLQRPNWPSEGVYMQSRTGLILSSHSQCNLCSICYVSLTQILNSDPVALNIWAKEDEL